MAQYRAIYNGQQLPLPGERPLLETNGDILWTQQRSSGVPSEKKKEDN